MLRNVARRAASSLATQQAAHNGCRRAASRTGAAVALLYSAGHSDDRSPLPPRSARPLSLGRRTSLSRSDGHQTDLPTQEEIPAQDPRVSHPDVDPGRTRGPQGTTSQGSQAPDSSAVPVISRHRLRGRRRFAATRTLGRRASSAGVRVHVAANQLDVARVGFALVGLRSSVRRNLLRRRLREVVRPLLGGLAGHDVVIAAGAEAAELDFGDLRSAVAHATTRALQRVGSAGAGSTTDNGVMSQLPGVDR
jgi:ribonuclease P protein component